MSRTSTAAETRSRGTPSFDKMWANLPEELSPSSSHRGDSFFCEDDKVNVNDLCRNTFVHLESSSPLARMSVAELVKSFKEFSAQINQDTTNQLNSEVTPIENKENSPYNNQEIHPSTPVCHMRNIFASNWKDGSTPDTVAESCCASPGTEREGVNLTATVFEKGSICDFVNKYKDHLKATKESSSDMVLLNQTPISQALLTSTAKKETPSEQRESGGGQVKEGNGTNVTTDVYREGHPYTCKPCAFYWSKGCLNGDKCLFCHLWHVPKRKKPMREQRNLMIIAKDDGKITFLRCSIKDVM